jgi:hypothetical protein
VRVQASTTKRRRQSTSKPVFIFSNLLVPFAKSTAQRTPHPGDIHVLLHVRGSSPVVPLQTHSTQRDLKTNNVQTHVNHCKHVCFT